MKKIIKSLIFAAVSAMTFYACSKAYDDIASTDLIKLTISTDKPELYDQTRTMVDTDGKTPMWCPEDAIGVSVFANGSYTNHEFTNDNTDAPSVKTTFSGSVAVGDMIYTYYPYSANGVDAQGRASVEIPSVQYPTPTSFDGAADILVGKPVVMTPATTTVEGLQFKRVGGFLKIVLNDTTAESLITGEKVESLSVTTENNLAGSAYLDIVNGELGNISANGTAKITAKYNSDTEYKIGDENSAAYIGVYSQTLTEGSTITISAKTTSYDIERTITLPVDIDIKAGGITTLNIKISAENISEKMLDIEETFPDPIFRQYVSDNFDTNKDGKISQEEALRVTSIAVYDTPDNEKIASLEGVQYFTNLKDLDCRYNLLTSLDVSKNTALTTLYCDYNQLTSLNVSNTALRTLYCHNNQLASLDVSNNMALTKLSCAWNQLITLDVSNNTALTDLSCFGNQLTSLDVSNNTALTDLSCFGNQLTSLDVSNNTALTDLSCNSNQLTYLDVSKNTALKALYCYNNQLTTLDLSNNTALTDLSCSSNQLTNLNVSGCTALTKLSCDSNQLTTLDVSNNTALETLYCYSNKLTTLDVSNNTALKVLYCYNNQLTTLNVSGCTALTKLNCGANQLTTLDVSNNTALTEFDCWKNKLTSLNVSENMALTKLNCEENQLTTLDVSNNTALTDFDCFNNKLTNLNVSENTALTRLNCGWNQLTALDVSNNTALTSLICNFNQLTTLDVSNNTALTYLYCSTNQLTTLDVSKTNLGNSLETHPLYCTQMRTLTTLYLKTGWEIEGITSNRSTDYIPEQTQIEFVSGD